MLQTSYARQTLWDTGKGSKIDVVTGLMWQYPFSLTNVNWSSAENMCSSLSLSGKSDWRLPNIKELMSVQTQIVATFGFWSSSAVPGFADRRRAMSYAGQPVNLLTTTLNNVVCVRDTSHAN
ncbi:Lcl C-terminal domain-containing protein [Arenicella chitinivorans]|uniref:Lcl C-terminal domain-containing protein n=1 Tax=Arenicella chitinivorans TaxID=1329800 RepID=UPI0035715E6D